MWQELLNHPMLVSAKNLRRSIHDVVLDRKNGVAQIWVTMPAERVSVRGILGCQGLILSYLM